MEKSTNCVSASLLTGSGLWAPRQRFGAETAPDLSVENEGVAKVNYQLISLLFKPDFLPKSANFCPKRCISFVFYGFFIFLIDLFSTNR